MKVRELFESVEIKEDFKNAILQNCSHNAAIMVRRELLLQRGLSYGKLKDARPTGIPDFSYRVIDELLRDRDSLTGSNQFMNFTKSSAMWEEFPDRTRSVFCATGNNPNDFGTPYLVIPFDSVKVYGGGAEDFNQVEIDGVTLLDMAMEHQDFRSHLDGKDPEEWMEENITPQNMGMKVYTSLDVIPKNLQEVWFQGHSIMIGPINENGLELLKWIGDILKSKPSLQAKKKAVK
jgi:hypothetical protein